MKNWNNIFPLLYCLLISILFRFPYFFKDVINWDESTFILTGQSLLDGYLPYTQLWDLKPPLLPAAFALFILIFGKSIISIRVAGAVCVAVTSWFTYLIGKKVSTPQSGYIAATLCALSLSVTDFRFFGTMSEHVAVVPLMGAVLMLIHKPATPKRLFWIGVLHSSATMVRLNLAYMAVALGLLAVFFLDHTELSLQPYLKNIFTRGVSYTSGGLLIVALTFLPYAVTGQAAVWWRSVVLAPLNYSFSRYTAFEALLVHLEKIYGLVTHWQLSTIHHNTIATLVYVGASVGIIVIAVTAFSTHPHSNSLEVNPFPKQHPLFAALNINNSRRWFTILITGFLSVVLSILNGGQAHSHYLIQLMPFLSLFAMFALSPLFSAVSLKIMLPVSLAVMVLMLPAAEYRVFFSHWQAGNQLTYGTAYEIADYFEQSNIQDKSIYMMTSHLAYWFIGKQPLTGTSTHPSNISKPHLIGLSLSPEATTDDALLEILEQQPDYIVTQPNISYLRDFESLRVQLDETLSSQYSLVHEIHSVQIYKRTPEPSN